MIRILIGCEFSGAVRRAFRARGFDAWSCDLLPAEDASAHHICADVLSVLAQGHWDALVAHPPCTYLANSGVRWLHTRPERWAELDAAAALFRALLAAPVRFSAVENPIMHRHAFERIGRRQDFCIQPWQHGHGEIKATCFWTKNLPPLAPSRIVRDRVARVHRASPSPDRWKERSRTLPGVAEAMADQWGAHIRRALGGLNYE